MLCHGHMMPCQLGAAGSPVGAFGEEVQLTFPLLVPHNDAVDDPSISVIMPAWQAEATIANTLASLQRQTYSVWEAVVIDDGSTDGTADAAEAVARKDPRGRVIRARHAGVSAARN